MFIFLIIQYFTEGRFHGTAAGYGQKPNSELFTVRENGFSALLTHVKRHIWMTPLIGAQMLIKYTFVARERCTTVCKGGLYRLSVPLTLGKSIFSSRDFTNTGRASRRLILPDKEFECYDIRKRNLCVNYALWPIGSWSFHIFTFISPL